VLVSSRLRLEGFIFSRFETRLIDLVQLEAEKVGLAFYLTPPLLTHIELVTEPLQVNMPARHIHGE